MKVLVIGGNGFIGSHLVDRLVELEWNVRILDISERRYDSNPPQVHFIQGDLTQEYLVREALVDIDVVIHLAWATIHEVSNQDPVADVHANLIPSIRLLEACRQANVSRVIFISSGGTIYGPAKQLPIAETHAQNPINSYGITKLAVEKYLQMFTHLYGLEHVILRPSVPYGPRQNPLGRQGAVAVFLYRVAQELPVTIWGDGEITRDYFYVTDLVEAIIISMSRQLHTHRTFNIGGSEQISLNKLLNLIEAVVDKKAIVKYTPARKFDAPNIVLDTNLAVNKLKWQPKIKMTQGLARTWAWMSATIL